MSQPEELNLIGEIEWHSDFVELMPAIESMLSSEEITEQMTQFLWTYYQQSTKKKVDLWASELEKIEYVLPTHPQFLPA